MWGVSQPSPNSGLGFAVLYPRFPRDAAWGGVVTALTESYSTQPPASYRPSPETPKLESLFPLGLWYRHSCLQELGLCSRDPWPGRRFRREASQVCWRSFHWLWKLLHPDSLPRLNWPVWLPSQWGPWQGEGESCATLRAPQDTCGTTLSNWACGPMGEGGVRAPANK